MTPDRPIIKLNNKELQPGDQQQHENGEKAEQRKQVVKGWQQKIGNAQAAVEGTKIDNYAEKFSEDAKKDAVLLAEVDVDVLNSENKVLEELKAQKAEKERDKYIKHKKQLLSLQEESHAELLHRSELMRKHISRSELESIEYMKEKQYIMRQAFRNAGNTLDHYLGDSKKEVQIKYKDMIMAYKEERHNLTGGMFRPGQEGGWLEEEQVVEMRLELIRCVKDKLPKGRYAVLCSVLDHIGGNVLDYQADRSKRWRRVTAPKTHSGEYHLNNIRFERTLLIATPKKSEVMPSMVYLFELFLLKSKEFSHDQVLGWGVFPLINADFELNNGNFKIPLLFGPVNQAFDKYCDIERTYRASVDNWLCNMYFSIRRKETPGGRYDQQLILDEETRNRNARYTELSPRQPSSQQEVTTTNEDSKQSQTRRSTSKKHDNVSYCKIKLNHT